MSLLLCFICRQRFQMSLWSIFKSGLVSLKKVIVKSGCFFVVFKSGYFCDWFPNLFRLRSSIFKFTSRLVATNGTRNPD